MAYTPNTWKDGDVITADKLNALENGVGTVKDGPAGKDGAAGAKGDKGDAGAAAPTITGIVVDAAAGKVTLTLSDKSTVEGTYTAKA